MIEAEQLVKKGKIKALVVNSGNANACTGVQGIHDDKLMIMAISGSTINMNQISNRFLIKDFLNFTVYFTHTNNL